MNENHHLLPQYRKMDETRQLLTSSHRRPEEETDEWLDSSCSSSCYSDSDSSIPEWESLVDEGTGELLYIDCHPHVTQNTNETQVKFPAPFVKTAARQSTRSKFLRLIRRRESKRRSKHWQSGQSDTVASKVKFQESQEGEVREVVLNVRQEGYFRNRRATSIESALGICVGTLSDGNRIMIAGFTQDGAAKAEKNIKIGDWLKSVNGLEIFKDNFEAVLEEIRNEERVTLRLQRVAGVEVTKVPPVNELSNQSKFVQELISGCGGDEGLIGVINESLGGVLYLDMGALTENDDELRAILYAFPGDNILCKSRGIYMTLNHLIKDVTKQTPKITSFFCNNKRVNVVYDCTNDNRLFLFSLSENHATKQEILLIQKQILRFLEFTYQSIGGLESQRFRKEIDSFFARFFSRTLKTNKSVDFEQVLPAASFLYLPKEAQLQIDDALTELEASDYREWNEDPLDCQRLFTIIGSALYHSGYLLGSHFVHEDLIDVHCYCQLQGLFQLSKNEPLRTLVHWKEVFPSSCNRGLENFTSNFKFPEGRRYLLVVGSGKELLAVLMEAGGCTEAAEENRAPEAFYIEEAQATLSHVIELGIPELAERWLGTNPGSQIAVPEIPQSKRKTDILGSFTKSISPSQNKDLSPKKVEVTSILKRRSSDQALLSQHSASMYSLQDDSEDTASQGGYSERSEVSDEPVVGRRAIREKGGYYESDEEESDDDYGDSSQISSSSYDLSELRHSLLADSETLQPLRLTAGEENVLFHYVQLDTNDGILVCPPESRAKSQTLDTILAKFRQCAHSIHGLFQNTLRFKNMSAQEMAKSVMNKSLIAIKEHGVCFECPFQDDRQKKQCKVCFWVIGRLFYMPHPREFYVCYEDTIPQNITEVAFKLGVSLGV